MLIASIDFGNKATGQEPPEPPWSGYSAHHHQAGSASPCIKYQFPTKENEVQYASYSCSHSLFMFYVFSFLSSSYRDQSWGTTFEFYMEQSSNDQEDRICEHFLLFSEHIICQCFLVACDDNSSTRDCYQRWDSE